MEIFEGFWMYGLGLLLGMWAGANAGIAVIAGVCIGLSVLAFLTKDW